jgi:hypothetical protein
MMGHGAAYYTEVAERFAEDIADHKLTIEECGPLPFRSILARRHRGDGWDSCYHFRVITYPGGLLYTGDMGTYVFQRCWDMFDWWPSKYGDAFDFRYIAEKCQAADKCDSIKQWSGSKAKATIDEMIAEHRDQQPADWDVEEDGEWTAVVDEEYLDQLMEVRNHVSDFSNSEYNIQEFYRLLYEVDGLEDVCEIPTPSEYSLRFVWCCHAVRWLIDEVRRQEVQVAA